MRLITKLPDTLLIVGGILLLFVALTWIIPPGEFDRELVNGREAVVRDSYHAVDASPQGLSAFLTAPLKGFIAAANIIGFVLIVGGSFTVLDRTGAIRAGLYSLVRYCERNPRFKNLIVPVIIIFFSLCGATFGMSEETLVFILITIPLALSLGYDAIVGVAIPFIGAGAGFAGAFINPFTLQIAQGFAGLQALSGWEYRLVVWSVFTLIAIVFIMRYARKVERNPELSLVKGIETRKFKGLGANPEVNTLTPARLVILTGFLLSIVMLILGAIQWDWYIPEISGLFLALGILSALIYRMSSADAVKYFYEGAKDMIAAAMIIALSKAILVVAEDGKIIDSILYYVSSAAKDLPAEISVQVMFFVQSAINFFVPSGSGQAALTMPIMAPLGDLLNISRQTTVLAFQFGDGISNLIIPTSYVTMGILAIAKIPYEKWFRWVWPLILIFFLAAMLLLIPPVSMFDY